jgi:hypothetical protein
MRHGRRRAHWLIIALTAIAVNILVLLSISMSLDTPANAPDAPGLVKGQSSDIGPDLTDEPTEFHEGVEGPVPEEEGKG